MNTNDLSGGLIKRKGSNFDVQFFRAFQLDNPGASNIQPLTIPEEESSDEETFKDFLFAINLGVVFGFAAGVVSLIFVLLVIVPGIIKGERLKADIAFLQKPLPSVEKVRKLSNDHVRDLKESYEYRASEVVGIFITNVQSCGGIVGYMDSSKDASLFFGEDPVLFTGSSYRIQIVSGINCFHESLRLFDNGASNQLVKLSSRVLSHKRSLAVENKKYVLKPYPNPIFFDLEILFMDIESSFIQGN